MDAAKPATSILQQVMAKTSYVPPVATALVAPVPARVAPIASAPAPIAPVVPAPAPIAQYDPMPQPAIVVVQDEGNRVVGGTTISAPAELERKPIRKNGAREKDTVKRQPRTCKRCEKHGGTNGKACAGRHPCNGQKGCEFFTEAGGAKTPEQRQAKGAAKKRKK